MKYEFFATSSSGMDVYIVTVSNDTGPLIMKCNCAAGEKGILCRHRKALITRKIKGVFTPPRRNDPEKLKEAMDLIAVYGIERKLELYTAELEQAEQTWLIVRSAIKSKINSLVEPKG
ncbi:SWIM zinc finger family protein [Escherichia coli]|uniref:SWIM zinc finger family protein n=2 Tax=Escherichia coli TaxID=562 RepID=UPI000494A558|nr:SWIM zinc finger family protein [Escherichia coli]EFX5492651.1 SWIM zinc finger family protein [Shigella sonnei]AQV21267.1 hypothetical protein BE957_20025 [Escherichia coli]EAC1527386.1 SWIM zinc finger family protein [Escherichia coli]EER2603717.1 SWIM zinc finger family protein [Escherichia coli]EEV5943955.1 SWIM zinc finger family protein [Escherichia coli]